MEKATTDRIDETTHKEGELTNPAKRLHALILPVLNKANGITVLDIWADAFGIDPEKARQDPHEVLDRLRMVKDEVDLLRGLMRATCFSSDLYEPALNAVIALISVSNLTSQWGNLRPGMQAEHLLALRWCDQAVESEMGMTHLELQQLLDSIAAFRDSVVNDELPEPVRAFVLHQVDVMIRGIHEYPIRGRQAVRDALKKAAVDMMEVHDDTVCSAPLPLRQKLAAFWSAGVGAAEAGDKLVKVVTGIAETVPKLINAVHAAAVALPQ